MTLEDIGNNKKSIFCFQCGSCIAHADQKFVVLMTEEGVIVIKNRAGQPAPMVFCSSDCLVFDCKQRYEDRILKGSFRKQFNTRLDNAGQLPERWRDQQA